MGVLYVTKNDYRLKKNGPRLTIMDGDDKTVRNVMIKEVEQIVLTSTAQISTELIFALMDQGSSILYMPNGFKTTGILRPTQLKTSRVMLQVRLYDDNRCRANFVRSILKSKLRSEWQLLARYGTRMSSSHIKNAVKDIKELELQLDKTKDVDVVRGYEGAAAQKYFSCFGHIISKSNFKWAGRHKHPSPDPVNAMLSFSYALLANEVSIAILTQGLDLGVGYLHSPDDYRDSLVYDFMEPFRAGVCDRAVLNAINLKAIKEEDFVYNESNQSYIFTEDAKRKWYMAFTDSLNRMNLENTMTYKEEIYSTVRNFALSIED